MLLRNFQRSFSVGRRETTQIQIFDKIHEIDNVTGIPYATAERFKPAKNWIQNDLKEFGKTPHFPQPDEFNKSNWKSLPRTILESEVKKGK